MKKVEAIMSLKNKINKEYNKFKNKPTTIVLGKRSIYISIIMFFYAFIFIGSRVQANISFMLILSDIIRVIAIICGIYLFYISFYMTYLQLKINRKWIGYLALIINITSMLYFIFVSYSSIIDILDTFIS